MERIKKNLFRKLEFLLIGVLWIVITGGCISKPLGGGMANETHAPILIQTAPIAPKHAYLKVGQSEQFTYWGHSIAINYIASQPEQVINVIVDGVEQTFKKRPTDTPRGVYWREGNLSFALKPIVWETRDGQAIPIYEGTWNTSEIYFELYLSDIVPTIIEDKQLQVVR